MARKVKATGGHPPVYTGKGRNGTGLGYHGKPRGATTPAKGMGYHGHPPASITGGRRGAKAVGPPKGTPPAGRVAVHKSPGPAGSAAHKLSGR